ncbi:hypothetical protein VKT23_012079 [Stygiomarasmius scandens]|uniref:AAA+ ATPase domain-containing protein n=1 Tax=Marasmiellus scandens TaxID=2682957 RepID=A0ABR1J9G2_9AGAR
MHRRFSSMVGRDPGRGSRGSLDYSDKGSAMDDASTINAQEETLTAPSLKVKRVDNYYSKWSKSWKYRNTSSKVAVESIPILNRGENDPWRDCLFVVVRRLPPGGIGQITVKIVVKSEYILKACKDVIRQWPGISWNSDPLELDPEIFLTFLEEFITYRDNLVEKKNKSELDKYVLSSVDVLLDSLHSDYQNTIRTIQRLKAHREITYDELYAILVPRSILVARCAVTGLPLLFKLTSWTRVTVENIPCFELRVEALDLVDKTVSQSIAVGRIETTIFIKKFKGTIPIDTLDIYPIQYHPEPALLRDTVIKRGKKWIGMVGVHHKEYDGVAGYKCNNRLVRQTVTGRIMIDRAGFYRNNPNYQFPLPVMETIEVEPDISLTPVDSRGNPLLPAPRFPAGGYSYNGLPPQQNNYANGTIVRSQNGDDVGPGDNLDLTEEELLLTPTVVYGFSLTDKAWLEFNVEKVSDVQWNDEAFANLVLPADRKLMLKSLVEAHHRESFDDFIKGKGHGLVINLFGPTGVGKTFSAEATSEHVRRPLYIVGAGDLGTDPARMDTILEKIFDLATSWKAIVLIDEADVFMEQRSLHDLERNAMVAVFLRHVEYYRGILFLTTNRVKAFDEAFLSRIHVALHFHDLPFQSKIEVWTAFIKKVGASDVITQEQIRILAQRDVNGRQIKNAAKTAQSLALGKGEQLAFEHFVATLDAMEGFTKEFQKLRIQNEDDN